MKMIQFELWKECHNCCSFCYNANLKDFNSKEDVLLNIISFLEDYNNIADYDTIGLIGGELLFNNLSPRELSLYLSLYQVIINYLKQNKINQVLIASSLIFDNFILLDSVFELFQKHNLLDKVLLCTSYDTIGRFRNNSELIWDNAVFYIHKTYPQVRLHTEIILTQDFINKVLDNTFDIIKFKQIYNTSLDFKEPNSGERFKLKTKAEINNLLGDFFPTRSSFLKFLRKAHYEQTIDLNQLLSVSNHSNTLYLYNNENWIKIDNRQENQASLTDIVGWKSGYIDSNNYMRNDVLYYISQVD